MISQLGRGGHWRESRRTLILDVWVDFLSLERLAKGIVDVFHAFWVHFVRFMTDIRIIGTVERTRGCSGYGRSRRDV